MIDKSNFIYPRNRYYGEVKLENLVFNANLQEFAHQVSYISNLETAGKLSPQEAYQKIDSLWQQVKHSKVQLGISEDPFESK